MGQVDVPASEPWRRCKAPGMGTGAHGEWFSHLTTACTCTQDMFIETLAEATEVGLSDICVLFLREKCGKRLLSSSIEVTVCHRPDSEYYQTSKDRTSEISREGDNQREIIRVESRSQFGP